MTPTYWLPLFLCIEQFKNSKNCLLLHRLIRFYILFNFFYTILFEYTFRRFRCSSYSYSDLLFGDGFGQRFVANTLLETKKEEFLSSPEKQISGDLANDFR